MATIERNNTIENKRRLMLLVVRQLRALLEEDRETRGDLSLEWGMKCSSAADLADWILESE